MPAPEKQIFYEALDLEGDERADYLEKACGGDVGLRERVDALFASLDSAGGFLEPPSFYGFDPTVGPEVDESNVPNPSSTGAEVNLCAILSYVDSSDTPGSLGLFAGYDLLEIVGQGGMSAVFRAKDPKLQRVVAMKILAPVLAADPTAHDRFLREARAMAAIRDTHVVQVYAVDVFKQLPYLVMEYVDGKTLQEKIDSEGIIPVEQTIRIATQIAAGLAAAHDQGLTHRDIKPTNILLENGVERVKITDFGLARAADDARVTHDGRVCGTPEFMSPEQACGEELDPRSDLFSLGCVLYAMCAGNSPFRAETTVAAIRRVCDDKPRPIRTVNPHVPLWMERLIERLIAKRREDRIQSAHEVAELLTSRNAPRGIGPGADRRVRILVAAMIAVAAAFIGSELAGWTRFTQLNSPGESAPREVTNALKEKPDIATPVPVPAPPIKPADKPVKVFILAGDAVMEGTAKIKLLEYQATQPETAPLFAHLRQDGKWLVRDDVWVANATRKGKLSIGFGKDIGRFGPELEFGQVVGDHFDQQVLLIKSGGAGDNLVFSFRTPNAAHVRLEQVEPFLTDERRINPNATAVEVAQRAGISYRRMQDDVRSTLARLEEDFPDYHGQGYEIAGLVLFLGWHDYLHFESGADYTRDLADFIRDVRKDLGRPNLPIVIGQFGIMADVKVDRAEELRKAQADVALLPEFEGNVAVVPTDVFWDKDADAVYKKGWREHFDEWEKVGSDFAFWYLGSAKTINGIGGAFAKAMIDLDSPKEKVPAAPKENRFTGENGRWSEPQPVSALAAPGTLNINPVLSADGLSLYFCRFDYAHPEWGRDIWVARRKSTNEPFEQPQRLSEPINSNKDEEAVTVSSDQLTLIVASLREGGSGQSDLWVLSRQAEDQPWTKATNIGPPINTDQNETMPWLSNDGLTLLFQREMKIYEASRTALDKPFSDVKLLPAPINNSGLSTAGWMSPDKLTVVLTARDRTDVTGLGYFDIWAFHRSSVNSPFGPPVNLGPPINSSHLDANPTFSSDGNTIFFFSQRQGTSKIFTASRLDQ